MITEEDLLLYHYGEGLSAERRAEIAAALAADGGLRAHWLQLLADLSALAHTPRVAMPATVQARLAARLSAAAAAELKPAAKVARSRAWVWPIGLTACASLVLAIGVSIGLGFRDDTPSAASTAQAAPAPDEGARFERGLRLHLADTELQLVGLAGAEPEARAALVARIVQENRMFARAAERAGEANLARVLRSFESVLIGMGEQAVDAEDVELRRQQLDFELGAMQTKLASDPSKSSLNI
jgi:hypothetical protein